MNSNFAFLNNDDFKQHPVCEAIYAYAVNSERYFKKSDDLCALNARRFLEQYLRFVSELKEASYPENCFHIGSYYSYKNEPEFLRVFGSDNGKRIKDINKASKPYLHTDLPKYEVLFKSVVNNIFDLCIWLYRQLFPGRRIRQTYNEKYTNVDDVFEIDVNYSSISNEAKHKSIKKLYPECDTDKLYQVERINGDLYIRDLNGKLIESTPGKGRIKVSEEKIEVLKTELNKIKAEYKTLDEKIQQYEQEGISVEEYKKKLERLSEKYSELDELYQNSLSETQQHQECLEQMDKLLSSKEQIIKDYSDKQNRLLGDIRNAENKLSKQAEEIRKANEQLASMNIRVDESDAIAQDMKRQLEEKEQELLRSKQAAEATLEVLKKDHKRTMSEYEKKITDIEMKMADVAAENYRYKEQLARMDSTKEVENYLLVLDQEMLSVQNGYQLYAQSKSERELRSYLLKVKNHYEGQINALNQALREKDEELKRWKYKAMESTLSYSMSYQAALSKVNSVSGNTVRKEKKKKKHKGVGFAFVILLLATGGFFFAKYNDKLMGFINGDKQRMNPISNYSDEELVDQNTQVTESVGDPITIEDQGNTEHVTEQKNSEGMNLTESVGEDEDKPEEDNSDQRIPNTDDLYSQINDRVEPPASIKCIPGINNKIVDEINSTYRGLFNGNNWYDIYQERYPGSIDILGRFYVPLFGNFGTGEEIIECRYASEATLIKRTDVEVFQFLYSPGLGRSQTRCDYVAGILPTDFCDGIDNDSTLEDFQEILGKDYKESWEIETDFCTSETEKGYVFICENTDAVLVLFNEENKLCDYIYLYITEGPGARQETVYSKDGVVITKNYFNNNPNLEKIIITSSVTDIEDGAFSQLEKLSEISVKADSENYASYDGCLYDKDFTTLMCIPRAKKNANVLLSITSCYEHALDDFSEEKIERFKKDFGIGPGESK